MSASDRGFALLMVTIALATLSLIFAAALATSREHLSATSDGLARTRLQAAIDGAVTTVKYELAAARIAEPAVLSAPQTYDIGGVSVLVSARPESAKIDLNAAGPSLIFRYLLHSGLSKSLADAIIDEIIEHRKESDPVYARRHDKAPARPFESVFELLAFKAMTADAMECVQPDLTVFTGLADVDPVWASQRVREADGLPAEAMHGAAGAHSAIAGSAVPGGAIFEVTARARDDATGQRQSRQAVLRVTGNRRTPVWTLSVQSPAPNAKEAEAACRRMQDPIRTASEGR